MCRDTFFEKKKSFFFNFLSRYPFRKAKCAPVYYKTKNSASVHYFDTGFMHKIGRVSDRLTENTKYKSDCIYHFPIDLDPIGRPFGSKSI